MMSALKIGLALAVMSLPAGQSADERIDSLSSEILRLRDENTVLRHELADARLASEATARELHEIRQFITDHREYGDDFARYQAMVQVAERESRRRQAEELRSNREQERAARRARFEEAQQARATERTEDARLDRYRRSGFSHLGLDVFGGRMAFAYQASSTSGSIQIDYDPFVGLFYRPGLPRPRVDFSRMTISGSVLNAAATTRNIGIAVAFFDESGNQVGGEIVQINNARPDVPYPFTATIEMALTRPFATSSVYVLYADPIQ